jgi:hypothetical protein
LLAGLIPAGLCLAQQEPANVPQSTGTVVKPAGLSEYWLGIVSEPVPDALRTQLSLPENQGLLVEQVAPQSPAAAVLQRYDILLKADGKALVHVGDLIAAVGAAKGKKINLDIVRKGKPMKVEVTPAKRPEGAIAGLLPPTPHEAWSKWMEQFRPGDPHHRDYSLFFLRPGVVVSRPGALPDLPNNVTIAVTKQGNQPAKIVVTRGDEKWEVTEGKLDALPPELRPHVEGMLRHPWRGALAPRLEGRVSPPADSGPPAPRLPKMEPRKSLENKLDEMSRRLEEMRKAFDELKKQSSAAKPETGSAKQ